MDEVRYVVLCDPDDPDSGLTYASFVTGDAAAAAFQDMCGPQPATVSLWAVRIPERETLNVDGYLDRVVLLGATADAIRLRYREPGQQPSSTLPGLRFGHAANRSENPELNALIAARAAGAAPEDSRFPS
ncbi:hypothetical protein [Leifsonia sp. Leaf264]|uniref:hypothetical protein n=1 Tax=Leifsonia sp. Leaf264 TaxID=1736314 RepID=UPI0006FFDCFB|nr:hypothetical protein [Leifsonia sp. Leaf264]KQO98478.1 hypothetical protein ASF30_10475 [Leifsonia sp. Leaf264]